MMLRLQPSWSVKQLAPPAKAAVLHVLGHHLMLRSARHAGHAPQRCSNPNARSPYRAVSMVRFSVDVHTATETGSSCGCRRERLTGQGATKCRLRRWAVTHIRAGPRGGSRCARASNAYPWQRTADAPRPLIGPDQETL